MINKIDLQNYVESLNYKININYISNIHAKTCLFINDYDHHLYHKNIDKTKLLIIFIIFTKHDEYTTKVKKIVDSYNFKFSYLPRDIKLAKISLDHIDNNIMNENGPYVSYIRKGTYE